MLSRALSSWGRLIGVRRGSAAEDERRTWARFSCAIETTCQPANAAEGERLRARVQDISLGGASLIVGRAFEPGELLSLELPHGSDGAGRVVTVLACVVRADVRAAGEWLLGCNFASELSDEDLQRFGARRARPISPDQRGWERFACQAHASFQPVRTPDAAPSEAQVINISASGAALQVREPLEVGELLSIELRAGDGHVVLTTLASIVRVATEGEGPRVLGCNFIHELGEAELKALV